MKKINDCRVIKTKRGVKIKITQIGNYTYVDFGNKISKLPYNLNETIEFLIKIKAI